MALGVDTAKIVSMLIEAVLFGVHLVLYFQAMEVLLLKVDRHRSGPSWQKKMLLVACTSLFLLAIVHISFSLRDILKGFVWLKNVPGATEVFFFDFHTATTVIGNFGVVTSSLIADSILAYRLYLVWSLSKVIIALPILLVISTAVTGYATTFLTLPAKNSLVDVSPWIKACFAATLCTNVLASALIAGRIWWASYRLRRAPMQVSGASHWEFVQTIVQSGMLSAMDLACLLGTFVAGSNAWFICFNILPPLIGVNFTLIIVRLGLERKTMEETLSSIVVARGAGADSTKEITLGLGPGGDPFELGESMRSDSLVGQRLSKEVPRGDI